MTELTPVQSEVLQAIRDRTRERGYPPTVRELCTALEVSSPSTVHAHLSQLVRKGYISRDPTKPRAMVVIDDFQAAGEGADTANLARYWAAVLATEGRILVAGDLRDVADELDRLRELNPVPDPREGR